MKSVKRLYHQFKPAHYQSTLQVSPKDTNFHGTVVITGNRSGRPTQRLTFHQKGLTITSAHLVHHDKKGDTVIPIDRINHHRRYDEVRLHSTLALRPGSYTITLQFKGKVTPQMQGIYPCNYKAGDQTGTIVATQFESHHAREAFPCIDEPEAKATFALQIETDAAATVLSNMPVATTQLKGTTQLVTFEPTPVMSTYLVAFAVGDFVSAEAKTAHGVQVRAWAAPIHDVNRLQFALEVATKALDFLDDYFGTPYPLPKCDLIALPDFAAGAMENWGCITFRESALLYDPETSDLSAKQYVAEVVVHELAHQWFGNLVTMQWWNDLWLNEGFASWVPYMVLDALYPEWKMREQFVAGDLLNALRADSLEHTHPIVVAVHSPEEIRTIFDSISYDKGCSAISLLHDYVGADAFRSGLQLYMQRHAYKNTTTEDLWQAIGDASKQDVRSFMHAWTTQPGYPIIIASEDGKTARQERFYINPEATKHAQHWPIPLLRDEQDRAVMKTTEEAINDLTTLNSGKRGFYRVAYADFQYKELVKKVQDPSLTTADCLGVLSDVTETAKAGYVSTATVLPLYSATAAARTDENSIQFILSELATIRRVFPETNEPMKPFLAHLLTPHIARLGIDKPQDAEPVDDELLRPSILASASFAGVTSVIEWAEAEWQRADKPEQLRPDARSVVYGHAVRHHNSEAAYEKLLTWYGTTNLPGERSALASALTGFKDEGLYRRALDLIMTPQVRLQDALYWVIYGFMNRHHKQLMWEWLKQNWDWVLKNFGNDMELSYFVRYAALAFSDQAHAADYAHFFAHAHAPGVDRPIKQGIETLQWQIAWRNRDEAAVVAALHDATHAS